nr:hypothetical protein [Tanacetum cinerariifolium]
YRIKTPLSSPSKIPTRQETKVLQPSSPTRTHVADKAASTGVDVRYGGAATTVSSLDAGQGSGNIDKTPSMPHDLLLSRVNTLESDDGTMTLNELTVLCTKLLQKLESLEADLKQTKKVYRAAYTKFIMKWRSMIEEIDQDAEVHLVTPTLVSTQGEAQSQESQPKDLLGVFSATKVLAEVAKVHTYTRRRRTISTASGGISTTEESVSTAGASMPQRQERAGYEATIRLQKQLDEEERQRIAKNPPYKFTWENKEVPISEGSPVTTTETYMEIYKNVSQDIRDQLNVEAEVVQIILTRIDNDIYSTVDACSNACKIWKAIKRSQQAATRNRGKAIVNSPQPIYDQEPSIVAEDEEMSKDKDIDKLMALISLSFKKIYKPTNNNLRTSSNTSRANQDNSPRINIGTRYENQRIGNVVGARETVGSTVVQKSGIQCYNYKEFRHAAREYRELEAHYMYMAQIQEVSPDAAYSGPIFDSEPVQKVSTDDHYNVFAIESKHSEQSESIHDTYPIEQDEHNVVIDSLDMSYDREQIDQNDDDVDLDNERELLASLIEKLKCEIDDNKNRNKFLETSNKVLIEKLKETNKLMYNDFKKSQAELQRRNDVEYGSKVEIDCAKAKGDLISYKMESQNSFNKYTQTINDFNQTIFEMKKKLFVHQETISILSQQKEAQIKLYKTHEDKELNKVTALENKVKLLDNIVYKTDQSVQTMNMLNNKCRMSFAKPEFLKKA